MENNNRQSPAERAKREAYIRERRLAEENAARRKKHEIERRKKKRKENAKIFGGRLLVFGIVLILLAAVAFGVFMLWFTRTPDAPSENGKIKYVFGGEEYRAADTSDCVTSHGLYFCFNDLSDYLGMAESGSASEMKFIMNVGGRAPKSADGTGDEEVIVFYTGGSKVNINGQEVTLDIPSFIKGDEVWVSLSFAEKYMLNLSVLYNPRSSLVSFARIKDDELSTDKNTVYKSVSFRLKNAKEELKLEENPLIGDVIFGESGNYDLDFNSDLDEYEQYMDPTDDKRDAFLVLVNKDSPLTSNDIPNDLCDIKHTSAARKTQQMRLYAEKSLEALFKEMYSLEYYDMSVFSGYVSFSYQDTLFSQYTANEMTANPNLTKSQAEEIVLTYSPRPGTSDHQTGLSVDMDTMGAYTTDFSYTAEYKWLEENAWKFGFILRYPEGKEDITGMAFEPWHYRYVGRYHALKIHESGLCLEEYLKAIKK